MLIVLLLVLASWVSYWLTLIALRMVWNDWNILRISCGLVIFLVVGIVLFHTVVASLLLDDENCSAKNRTLPAVRFATSDIKAVEDAAKAKNQSGFGMGT